MHNIREISENIYYVGVNDRTTQRFENMFPLPDGVSYNAYVINGEKTCLIDTSDSAHSLQLAKNLEAALKGKPLDYLIVQHMEPDHCGGIEFILNKYPEAKLVGGAKTFTLFEQFFSAAYTDRYYLIKENDELDLGGYNLKFVFAPMVHWPEVFMSYETERKILFSADAFGAFGVIQGNLFVDELYDLSHYIDESRRYYVNIVGRHGQAVQRLFNKIKGLEFKMFCPLHSLCFRTPESIQMIMEKYQKWSSYEAEEQGILLAFASMYGNTALLVDKLASILSEKGMKNIRVIDISQTQASYTIAEAFKYNTVVFAAMNYNTELYVLMESLICELLSCAFQNHKLALIGNMSWGGRAVDIMKEHLAKGKNLELIAEPFMIKSSLKEEQLGELESFAEQLIAATEVR